MLIYNDSFCAACYFRTAADPPAKKCLLQLTERCNLHCQHCFVSSVNSGNDMDYGLIESKVIPSLIESNVTKVTLTGGEPFVYSLIVKVLELLINAGIEVSICTNASLITSDHLNAIKKYKHIHFNVSLDGFSVESHGKFRGFREPALFDRIIGNIKQLGGLGLLNGILVTPNIFTPIDEYKQIYDFAKECGARYILFNPLSQFGRGERSAELAYPDKMMNELRNTLQDYSDGEVELVFIRFPNAESKPLGKCHAGDIFYIFTNGEVTFCPYMVFAAKDEISHYDYKDFVIGNVFDESFNMNDCKKLMSIQRHFKSHCNNCSMINCGKGCYASIISQGNKLEDCDRLCPLLSRKEI